MDRIFTVIRVSRAAILVLLTILSGCGGGTTGTSSTGELRFAGYIQQSTGARVTFTPMVVLSGTSEEEILTASTDQQGDFNMSLPATESSVAIEISGKRTPPVIRTFSGSSVLSTVVTRTTKGNLAISGSFEVRIATETLCSSLRSEDNDLIIQGDIQSPCMVKVIVNSSEYPLSTFQAVLEGSCNSGLSTITSSNATTSGEIILDIAEATRRGCTPTKVSLFSTRDTSRLIELPFK